MLSSSLKEAIKISLAVGLTIALALFFQWDKPYWAAITVIAISANESFGHGILQGKLRIVGTLTGILFALLLISQFSQDRLLFIVFFHLFLGVCVFFSSHKRNGYAFTMAFAVFAIVAMIGGTEGTASFDIAILRIQETMLGVVVYSAVYRFIWPITTESLFFDILKTVTKQFTLARKALVEAKTDKHILDAKSDLFANQQHIDKLQELLALPLASTYRLRYEKAKWQSVTLACDGIQAHLLKLAKGIQHEMDPNDLDNGVTQLGHELRLLNATITNEQSKDAELIQHWTKRDSKLDAKVDAEEAGAKRRLLRQRLTNVITAVASSLTCFGLWIYFAIPGGPIFPLVGAALANACVHMPVSLIRQAKLACLAWGALFLVEYCLVLTNITELGQLVAFYSLNTLLIFTVFNKPSHVVIRILGGNLLLIMTMNALHGTPKYEIITPLLMLIIMLLSLTVARFYIRLFKAEPL
ncbi:FUSC family protein [Shewanella marisflavi]|uniref:FUSC family protein n=1 Tax=Shewanella marisflavi TaxID=260364 RepID=UPI003AAB63BA